VSSTDSAEATIDEVYAERNILAVTLAAVADEESGWQPAPDADPMEWGVVWIETPEGQVSWHVPRSLCESSPLPEQAYEYDGHDDELKETRLVMWGSSVARQRGECNHGGEW